MSYSRQPAGYNAQYMGQPSAYNAQYMAQPSGSHPQYMAQPSGYNAQYMAPQASAYNPQFFPPANYNPQFVPISDNRAINELSYSELYWRERYTWLLERGYQLPERLNPNWTPSWYNNPKLTGKSHDSMPVTNGRVVNATKIQDRTQVVLKRVNTTDSGNEVRILSYFSKDDASKDPRNHTCPLLEVLTPPGNEGEAIIVMPALRAYNSPDFGSIGEALDFILQVLEGFAFLHEQRVAHRGVRSDHIMMDARRMYNTNTKFYVWSPHRRADSSRRVHPRTRTEAPPNYFIIDFNDSNQYGADAMPPSHVPVYKGNDPTVPELADAQPCDPFPIDVYTVGNLILTDFIEGRQWEPDTKGRRGFEFLLPLVNAMTEQDPARRPTMSEALQMFEQIVTQQTKWKLRSRPKPKAKEGFRAWLGAETKHWSRQLYYITRQLPAIPRR